MFRRVAAAPRFTNKASQSFRNYVTHDNHHAHGEASFAEVAGLTAATIAMCKIITISGEK